MANKAACIVGPSEAEQGFTDVIWTDECSVQMESHYRFCCGKKGEPPRNKQRSVLHTICSTYVHCMYLYVPKAIGTQIHEKVTI